MADNECCPACGRAYGVVPKRICALCGKQITKHHKWQIVDSKIQHRICSKPDAYTEEK